MSSNKTESDTDTATTRIQQLVSNPERALRAEKSLDDYRDIDGARTAVRYVGTDATVPMFQILSTRVKKFPEGTDFTGIHSMDEVVDWLSKHLDAEEISIEDDDFEPTDYGSDPLNEVSA